MILWVLLAVAIATNFYFWFAGKIAGREEYIRRNITESKK